MKIYTVLLTFLVRYVLFASKKRNDMCIEVQTCEVSVYISYHPAVYNL